MSSLSFRVSFLSEEVQLLHKGIIYRMLVELSLCYKKLIATHRDEREEVYAPLKGSYNGRH